MTYKSMINKEKVTSLSKLAQKKFRQNQKIYAGRKKFTINNPPFLYDFDEISLQFDTHFYGKNRNESDRSKMTVAALDIADKPAWMTDSNFLKVENGLFEWIVPQDATYRFTLESRSTQWSQVSVSSSSSVLASGCGVTKGVKIDFLWTEPIGF